MLTFMHSQGTVVFDYIKGRSGRGVRGTVVLGGTNGTGSKDMQLTAPSPRAMRAHHLPHIM